MTLVNQALALRTKLLVAEYGRKRVIAALADAVDVDLETIEREVDAVRERRPSRRRRRKSIQELLKEGRIKTETFAVVERIACAYENKRYLPDLWRVRRFLESRGIDASKVRTRTAALPLVIGVLGGLRQSELAEIETGLSGSARGDLRIITDQILGRSKETSRTGTEMARKADGREVPGDREGDTE